MTEIQRIADQLRRSVDGGAWHGPALRELLNDLSLDQALHRPLPAAHNIWELTLHLTSWQQAAALALGGQPLPTLPWSADWPAPAAAREEEWHQARAALFAATQQLLSAVEELTDDRLKETVPGRQYSVYFLLHGIVQHNIYHAGQLAILKK